MVIFNKEYPKEAREILRIVNKHKSGGIIKYKEDLIYLKDIKIKQLDRVFTMEDVYRDAGYPNKISLMKILKPKVFNKCKSLLKEYLLGRYYYNGK